MKRALKHEATAANARNQIQDAQTTPNMNQFISCGDNATLNEPSSIDTSMSACGLNHVTTQAIPTVFMKDTLVLSVGAATSRDRMSRSQCT